MNTRRSRGLTHRQSAAYLVREAFRLRLNCEDIRRVLSKGTQLLTKGIGIPSQVGFEVAAGHQLEHDT